MASLLVVLAVLTERSRFDDPDMWWHLKMGQIIWTTHTIPVTDLFSFTTNHHAWIPHEWLSQTLIYSAWLRGGLSGLMLWQCCFASAIFIAGYILCSLYSGNAKVSVLGALVIFVFATVGLSVRPQMVGYLLLIFELLLIHLGRTRSARWFWGLPPLFALWVNCHGSFFLGMVVAGVFFFSSFFHFRIGSFLGERWAPEQRKTFLIAWMLSIAALFLNPVGLKLVLYPFDTFIHQPIGLSTVQEWQPMQLNSQRGVIFLLVLGCSLLAVIARKSELHFEEALLLALGIWLAGSHDRMLFVFGILAAPVFSRLISTLWDGYDHETDRIAPNAILMALALLIAYAGFPSGARLNAQVVEKSPVKAVEFIKAHHLAGPMINDYTYGGYLIWAMPEHPVFVDGRGDVFEWAGVLEEFAGWATLQADPNVLLNKYGIQFCLLDSRSPMNHVLALLPNWKSVYTDANSTVFIRTGSVNHLP